MNTQPNVKPSRKHRWSPLTALALPALLVLVFEPGPAEAGSPPGSREASARTKRPISVRKAVNQIDGLTVEELDDGTTILRLRGNVKPTFNVYRLSSPDRLIVDISASERGKAVPHVPVDSWAVGRVTISSVEEHDSKLARVVVNLKRESSYIVVPNDRDLVVTITPKEVAPEAYFARKSAGKRKAEIESMHARAERHVATAQSEVETAQGKVKTAQGKVKTAQSKAKSAERRAESAEDRASDAEDRAQAASGRASAAQSEAEQIRAEAEAIKAEAEVEASKLESAARKRASKLEQDARDRAEKIEDKAAYTLLEARKVVRHRAEKLAAVEAKAVAAERDAEQAEARARQAQAEAVAAQAYAKRVREGAKVKTKTPANLLAVADDAMADAQSDSERASAIQKQAETALGEARKARRAAGKRAKKSERVQLERAVRQAEAAKKVAEARVKAADGRLASLTRDRGTLVAALEDKRTHAEALRGRDRELTATAATAQHKLEQAEAQFRALGGSDGPADKRRRGAHRRAKAKYADAKGSLERTREAGEAEQNKLEDHKAEVAEAGKRLGETLEAEHKRESLTEQWEREREAAGEAKIRDVRFVDRPDAVDVVVELDGPVIYDASSLTPNMNMLELRNAAIPRGLERSLDTTSFHGPVDRITSFREGDDVKIVVASGGGGPSEIKLDRRSNRLIWTFPKSAAQRSRAARDTKLAARIPPGSKPDSKPGTKLDLGDGPVQRSEVVSLGGTKVSGFSTPPVFAARPGGTKLGSRSRWRGERIDIELQDAPIKDVLLLFADIGRVNIIAGPEVQGAVTMKLSAVPWDQALDIILRSLALGMVQEGNVIRVAAQSTLEEERRKAIEEANAQVQLKPLDTRLIPLSYATVEDMLPKVQSVLSSRGSVTPDSRTNTLILMDVAENIALAESLVRQLDSQTPQVLIEARIVEARTNWLRQLGIQWGFDFTASPGTGNPTGLLFPNSIGVGGGSGSNQSPVSGLILPGSAANPNYAVDLPAAVSTGSGGALGFSFGSLAGNLNTNLRLSAAEDEGEVRIISAPKIVTLDNTEAQIEQGVQIPISQISAQGVNTRYVNATLGLKVTPHVTNEGAVLLEVQVQKNEADFVNTGARGDPTILTKSADSQLLITDGDTAVIGGIYTRNQAVSHSKVPWFADIPIIGWFFKNKTERDDRSEMLIFLTPRIVNRAESIGG